MVITVLATYNGKPVYRQVTKLSVDDKGHLLVKVAGGKFESTKISTVSNDGCEVTVETRSGSVYRLVCLAVDATYPYTAVKSEAESLAQRIIGLL